MALEAGEHALETFTSLQEARDLPEPLPGKKAPSRRRKTCFACMKAGKEQDQPQLYGTSYFLVKMALTGHSFGFSGGLRAMRFSLKSTFSREILQRARCIMYVHLALQATLYTYRTLFRFRYADPHSTW